MKTNQGASGWGDGGVWRWYWPANLLSAVAGSVVIQDNRP